MHPSFSGLLVTCAYLPHTTLPPGVTSPSSLTFTCSSILQLTCKFSSDRAASLKPPRKACMPAWLAPQRAQAQQAVLGRGRAARLHFEVELEQRTSMTVPFVITPNCV